MRRSNIEGSPFKKGPSFILLVILATGLITGCLHLENSSSHPLTPYEPEVQQRIDSKKVPETHPNATLQNPESVEYWILAFVNHERLEEGREPLVWSPRLAQVADYRSYDMENRDFFSHSDPDGNQFDKYLEDFSYEQYNHSAENIVIGNYRIKTISPGKGEIVTYNDPKRFARILVKKWMYSGEHRWAMIHADFSVSGVGVYGDPAGEVKATQLFVDRERFDRAVDANTTEEFRVPIAEEDPLEDESGLENYPSHLGSNDDDDR